MKDKGKEEYVRKQFTEQYRQDETGKLHAQADRLADSGNFRDAIDAYTRLLQMVQIYEAYTNRGACYTRVEQYDNAVADFTTALKLKPDHPHAYINYNNRGYARQNQKQYDSALEDFATALQLNGAYAEAHYNKAETLKEIGRSDEAINSYEAFIRFASPNAFPHHAKLVEEARRKIAHLKNPGAAVMANIPPGYEEAAKILFGGTGFPDGGAIVQKKRPAPRTGKSIALVVLSLVGVYLLLAALGVVPLPGF